MKNENNKFDLEKRLEQFNIESAQLLYDLASDLLNQIPDEDILQLYQDYNDIFSKLSSLSKEEILKERVLLQDAVAVLISNTEKQELTEEDFENMTMEEIVTYVSKLMKDKDLDVFDLIKMVESK